MVLNVCKVVAVLALPVQEPEEPSILTPVKLWEADALLSAIEVVPTNKDELPNTAEGIVPDKLPAVRLVKLAPDTAPKEPDQVPVVTVPVVVKLVEPAKGDAPIVL